MGEQPGDLEDRTGRPFVGPAGKLLDRALAAAGIERDRTFVTNVVKHFNWRPGEGKQRIHKKPSAREIGACRRWLDEELSIVRPRAILALGATSAQALLGPAFRVSAQRGVALESPLAPLVMATVHPSSLLRLRDDADRRRETERFIEDLRRFRRAAEALRGATARRARSPRATRRLRSPGPR